ncbi:virion structural protein [Synechococcus phage S-SZBM1]|uniref:Virion structural protein n=1 Tax=Synechococcus phage S-SZBM1 TaxID=2926475 RepID=A0AC61TSS6_9CAUD|nr:virion structural protein [Synechococcus phage S-SZBM1]UNH61307.1 virion structural protein [Synechococcus phage S-SZBM1]
MAIWNKKEQDFLNQERSLFETINIADHWGEQTDWRPSFTGKNRFKVSPYQTTFFNTFQYGVETDVWETDITGTAAAVHDPSASKVTMSVGSTAGDRVIRQTRQVMRYIPGRASLISFAIRMETPVAGVRRRFGVFDENNGAFFEDDGGTYSCVIRSKASGSVVENRVTRDNWNGDKLDGTGPSQITASATAIQMINIEYEWYGAGQVIFTYTIDGETHVIHKFNTANRQDTVWCATPFLPIRCELENVTGAAGTHYLHQGSNSLTQEGEPEKLGTLVSYSNPITGTTLTNANTFYPVLSLRLKPTALAGIVLPRSLQVATNDNTNVFWKLIENPTLTGGTWVNHPNPDAITQVNTTSTAMTGGVTILSGFTVGGGANLIPLDEKASLQIGRSSLGTVSDTYTLACASPNTNKAALAVLNWLEQR